jgi:hypothetical protein
MKKRGVLIGLLVFILVFSISAAAMPEPEQTGGGSSSELPELEDVYGTSQLDMGAAIVCFNPESDITGFPVFKELTVVDFKYDMYESLFGDSFIFDENKGFFKNWDENFDIDFPTNFAKVDKVYFPRLNGVKSAIKPFLYEGNCHLLVKAMHTAYEKVEDGKEPSTPLEEPFDYSSAKLTYNNVESVLTIGSGSNDLNSDLEDYHSLETPVNLAFSTSYAVNWDKPYIQKQTPSCIGKGYDGDKFSTVETYEVSTGMVWNKNDLCCGDDYLWIMNGAFDYDGSTNNKNVDQLCLYSYGSVVNVVKDNVGDIDIGNMPGRNVYCTPAHSASTIHSTYDPLISSFDPGDPNKAMNLFQRMYNDQSSTTDVGVRYLITKPDEPEQDKAPIYCHHYFDNTQGDMFSWYYGQEAGEIHYFAVDDGSKAFDKNNIPKKTSNNAQFMLNKQAPDYIYDVVAAPNTDYPIPLLNRNNDKYLDSDELTICNVFLGGEWTGHHCCGGKYDYDANDMEAIKESYHDTAENGMHYVFDSNEVHSYTLDVDKADLVPNSACYQGEAIKHGEVKNELPNNDLNPQVTFKELSYYTSDNILYCDELGGNGKPTYNPQNQKQFPNNLLDLDWCCKEKYGNDYHFNQYSVTPLQSFTGFNCYYYTTDVTSFLGVNGALQLCTSSTQDVDTKFGKSYAFSQISSQNYNEVLASPLFSTDNDKNVHNLCDAINLDKNDKSFFVKDNTQFYYCFTNNTWLSFPLDGKDKDKGTTSAPTPFGILGREPKTKDEKLSQVPVIQDGEIHNPPFGCCFQGDCWDGKTCVQNGFTIEKPNKVFLCANGNWKTGNPTYNWFNETYKGDTSLASGTQYCADPWACACPAKEQYPSILGEKDGWTIKECEKYTKPNNQCTRFPWAYVGDRFCVATDPGTDPSKPENIKSSAWTTRTKYLATAMLKLVPSQDKDFILNCDAPENVFNFYPEASQYWDTYIKDKLFVKEYDYSHLNHFCVLVVEPDTDTEKVYVGTTLNPLLKYTDVPEPLYKASEEEPEMACSNDGSEEECEEWNVDEKQYICYKPSAAPGECKLICGSDAACKEEYALFGEHECKLDDPDGFGVCVPKTTAEFEMLDITPYLTKIFYGNDDVGQGLVNSPFMLNVDGGTENELCLQAAKDSNIGGANNFIKFKKCKSENILFNNFTASVIYTKNADDMIEQTLAYSEVAAPASSLATNANLISTYYKDKKDTITEWENIDFLYSMSDFDTIYYAKIKGKTVFGIMERKSDDMQSPKNGIDYANKLRYFYIVKFAGFDGSISCDAIEEAATRDAAPRVNCFKSGSDYYIFSRPTKYYVSDDPLNVYASEFWDDLTTKLRFG